MRAIPPTRALLCAAMTLTLGCGVDQRELASEPEAAALGFRLVTEPGVELDTLRCDVNTPDGADVLDRTLDVTSGGGALVRDRGIAAWHL